MASGSLTGHAGKGGQYNGQHGSGRATGKQGRDRPKEAYSVALPGEFSLERFADPDNLYYAYCQLKQHGGPGAGLDDLTFTDFSEGEEWEMLRALSKSLLDQTYRPYALRQVTIPKGNGKFRRLSLQQLADRIVSKALLLCLDKYWRQLLPGVGRDVWHIYAMMERAIREEGTYILAIDDVRDCYPSVSLDKILDYHKQYIHQPDLLWLITQVIMGQDGPMNAIGLAQGSPYSPVAMELALHHSLDTALDAQHRGYTRLRYVDNLTFLCSSVSQGNEILTTAREILEAHELSLKGEDGQPQDIRDPGYNRSVLGLIPHWEDGQLKPLIPQSAFKDLREEFQLANEKSKATEVARQVAYGWISALGPALPNAVRTEVVARVLSIARECGFREIPYQELMKKAWNARQRWLELR